MKTIMITDDVYEMLKILKGEKSFSELLREILTRDSEIRKKYILKFFGILGKEEFETLEEISKEVRKNARARIFRYVSNNRIS